VDASQELFALGFSNILGSFVRSFPLAGSFSRTAVNNGSGVKTPLGGLMTGKAVELIIFMLCSNDFTRRNREVRFLFVVYLLPVSINI
jgi:sodium-independent sulfate anion transporter 11